MEKTLEFNAGSQVSSVNPIARFLIDLAQDKKKILGITFVAMVIAVAMTLRTPNVYTAKAVVFVPKDVQLSAFASILQNLPGTNNNTRSIDETYAAMMQTEVFQDTIIRKFNLGERYKQKNQTLLRRSLQQNILGVLDRKAGFLYISATDTDPEFSAQLANGIANELKKMGIMLVVNEARERRQFYERQLENTKQKLAEAELFSRQEQAKNGVMSLDAQTNTTVNSLADLRAQITTREIQIQAMNTYATPKHPDMIRLNGELNALKSQLKKIEQGNSGNVKPIKDENDFKAMESLRVFREVKYLEAVVDSLVRLVEVARMDETTETPQFQLISPATKPDFKSGPHRVVIVLSVGIIAFVFSVLIFYMRRNPSSALKGIRRAWFGR